MSSVRHFSLIPDWCKDLSRVSASRLWRACPAISRSHTVSPKPITPYWVKLCSRSLFTRRQSAYRLRNNQGQTVTLKQMELAQRPGSADPVAARAKPLMIASAVQLTGNFHAQLCSCTGLMAQTPASCLVSYLVIQANSSSIHFCTRILQILHCHPFPP